MRISAFTEERKGELYLFLSSLVFTIVTLLVKVASSGYSGMFVATWRFIVGIVTTIIVCKMFKISMKIENRKDWLIRGFFGSTAMVAFYLSIQMSTISRASLLCNTSPVFVAIFGFLFFKERIKSSDILSLTLCFLGVVFIFYDRGVYSIKGDIAGLLSAIFSGIAIHYVKKSSMVNNSLIVYMSPCILGLLFFPFTIHEYHKFEVYSFSAVLLVGLLTVLAQYFMTSGYRCVNPTKGSVLNYLQIPLTLILGAVFTHDPFPFKFLFGMILILSGLLVNILNLRPNSSHKTGSPHLLTSSPLVNGEGEE
ncbi:MAG TPA: DMT family transporter [Chitinispirillaceae bacterium]|nr:DMT family transporter [Chitinispirillaceae bacterium]